MRTFYDKITEIYIFKDYRVCGRVKRIKRINYKSAVLLIA